ncbi:MAG: hypothetical protein ACOC1K_06165 [Nanoarchaeota archaeon]
MSFDPEIDDILQYAYNFFDSAYAIFAIFAGVSIGAFILFKLIQVVKSS